MNLSLTAPLAFFDLETTGTSVTQDRIVEIAILKILPDGTKELRNHRVNPTVPIPAESTKFHGLTDADVANEPTFKDLSHDLLKHLEGCDLAGFNSNKFDVPLLAEEFLRVGVDFSIEGRNLIDVQNIFHKMEQRTLVAAFQFYCQKDLINAHSAEADTVATYEILEAQIEKYSELKNDMNFLNEFSNRSNAADLAGRIVYNDNGVKVLNFGKHKGRPVSEVLLAEPSYYSWMMKGDFPLFTKKVLTEIKEAL